MLFSATVTSLFAALAIAAPSTEVERRAIDCTNGFQDVNGQRITIQCGKDYEGVSFKQIANIGSAQNCANACAAEAKCAFAAQWKGFCYLKEAGNLRTPTSDVSDRAAIDIRPIPVTNTCASPRTSSGRTITSYCAQDYVGVSYAQNITDDAIQCGNQCAADPRCQYASFWRVHCYFKETTTGLGPASEVTALQMSAVQQLS
jgi:hypothetical protein